MSKEPTSRTDRRRTKIVATLGPATDDREVLAGLIRAGADVVRINFSHGGAEQQRERIATVREVASDVGRFVGIMGDLQGPKIRIESFRDGPVELVAGDTFTLDTQLGKQDGDRHVVRVAYEALVDDVVSGDVLLLDDGAIVLKVRAVDSTSVTCEVVTGGTLSNKKGLNKRGGGLSAPALTDKDRGDIAVAAELQLDYIAVSFAQRAEDIEEARRLVREAGGEARIVAKIERAEAVTNIESLVDASDVLMVARGDLAVEVGYAELTGLQKRIIHATRAGNKVSITATQMMESMITNASPTRAEVSDVSNAVMDGTDAVMLSAESAVGRYPVQAVETMGEICRGAEKYEIFRGRTNQRVGDEFRYVDEAIAMATMYTANQLDVKAIIALTESGSTALWMSRVRSDIPIYAFTRHEGTRRRVTLYRGVYPVAFDVVHTDPRAVYASVFNLMLEKDLVKEGDLVLFTKGDLTGVSGRTNSMKIIEVTRQADRLPPDPTEMVRAIGPDGKSG